MRNRFASLAVVSLALVGTALYLTAQNPFMSQSLYSTNLQEEESAFLSFLSTNGKSYATKEEYALRFDLFRKTLEAIKRENANPANTF